jgi:aryl-alcohol dehydrogenase-like predicted oxidoreductase
MRYRQLGRTGIEVSEIGYGAWGIGGKMWLGASDDESIAALRRAFELGLNRHRAGLWRGPQRRAGG